MDVDRSGPGGYLHCRLFSLLLRRNGDCRMFTQPAPSINCGFQKHGGLTGTALLFSLQNISSSASCDDRNVGSVVNESRVAKILSFAKHFPARAHLACQICKSKPFCEDFCNSLNELEDEDRLCARFY